MSATRMICTPILMRVWKDVETVFAILPTIPDYRGDGCRMIRSRGVEFPGDFSGCMRLSRRATEEEGAELFLELQKACYAPRIVSRATKAMHEMRVNEKKRPGISVTNRS